MGAMPSASSVACALLLTLAATPAQATPQPSVDAFVAAPLAPVRAVLTRVQAQPGLRLGADEPRLDVPTVLWSARAQPEAAALPLEVVARARLAELAPVYRATPEAWAQATLERTRLPGGAQALTARLPGLGTSVLREGLHLVFDARNQLVAALGYLHPERAALSEVRLDAARAARVALGALGDVDATLSAKPRAPGEWTLEGPALTRPSRAWRTTFALPGGLLPAYAVELHVGQGDAAEDVLVVVSAHDGRTLLRRSLVDHAGPTLEVWAEPSAPYAPLPGPAGYSALPYTLPSPSGWSPTPVARVRLAHDDVTRHGPWLTGAETRSNHAVVYADLQAPDGLSDGDVLGQADAAGDLVHPWQPGRAPEAQLQATLAQVYYTVNWLHDWYLDAGFDAAAGNAQLDNGGAVGRASDPVLTELLDHTSRNNANMMTPPDGASPRLQLFAFDDRNSAEVRLAGPGALGFAANYAAFGPSTFELTAPLVTTDEGCAPGLPAWAGKIVLASAGGCSEAVKATHARTAGAVALLVAAVGPRDGAIYVGGSGPDLPTLTLTRAAGDVLRALPPESPLSVRRARAVALDGALDTAIVAHEWGHHVSHRLIGDATGLNTLQSRGLGEGWSDFMALLVVVRAEDVRPDGAARYRGSYGIGGYSSYGLLPTGYYFGARRVPYSVDFAKNALTFKHIQASEPLTSRAQTAFGSDGSANLRVHSIGEVWATALWSCYAALLSDTRYDFEAARTRMRDLLVASLRVTPILPTFVEARDALLAVALAQDAADHQLLAEAFARRGLGSGAEAPERASADNRPVLESYEVGAHVVVSPEVQLEEAPGACDSDGVLDAGERGRLAWTITNRGAAPSRPLRLRVDSAGPLELVDGDVVVVPALAPRTSTVVRLAVRHEPASARSAAEVVFHTDEDGTTSATVSARFTTHLDWALTAHHDDVEGPSVWTTTTSRPASPAFVRRRAPSGGHHWYGQTPGSTGELSLTSPPLTVGDAPLVLTFRHRHQLEYEGRRAYDGAVVELSAGGGEWVDIGGLAVPGYGGTVGSATNPLLDRDAYVGQSAGYPAWIEETLELGTTYAGQQIRVRFRLAGDESMAWTGWELDDLAFAGLASPAFPSPIDEDGLCTNHPPEVTAGAPQRVTSGQSVELVAEARDLDDDTLTLTWTQLEGPSVALSGARFVAPPVTTEVTLAFAVVASDGRDTSTPARAEVVVIPAPSPSPSPSPSGTPEPVDDAGCACATTGSTPGGALAWLLGLALLARRRPTSPRTRLEHR
jgi:MYXO-CTERM domain-containing protein